MGSHAIQGGGRDLPLRGSERGLRSGEEYFRPGWRPPPVRALDGLATCWAYDSQGGFNSNCNRKWDHFPCAARTSRCQMS